MTTTDQLTAALTAFEQQLSEDKAQLPALAAAAAECGDEIVVFVPDEDVDALRATKPTLPAAAPALWCGVRG
jgi:predicted xylose isomerase-like sugar epimerase